MEKAGKTGQAIHIVAHSGDSCLRPPLFNGAENMPSRDSCRPDALSISELDLGTMPKGLMLNNYDWEQNAKQLCMGLPASSSLCSQGFCNSTHALASLVPEFMNGSLLRNVSSNVSAQSFVHQDDWDRDQDSSDNSRQQGRRGHPMSPKKRRPFRRQASPGSRDDDDYEPIQKCPRIKKSHSEANSKHKSPPGRARLTMAGTACCIRDLDPKWQGMDAPMVLVAKTLTKSDTLGRIILPRIAVETSMSFLTTARDFVEHRAYTLAVTESSGRPWQFVIKSWANGSEARRVYVLEQALLFLRTNQLREGDVVGICCDEDGNFQVAANTPELTEAVLRPSFGMPLPKKGAQSGKTQSGNKMTRKPTIAQSTPADDVELTSSHSLPRAKVFDCKVPYKRQQPNPVIAPVPETSLASAPWIVGTNNNNHASSSCQWATDAVPENANYIAEQGLNNVNKAPWNIQSRDFRLPWGMDDASVRLAFRPYHLISAVLTKADIRSGQARFPLLEAKQALDLWQSSSLDVQSKDGKMWALRCVDDLQRGVAILQNLGGMYNNDESVRAGSTLRLTITSHGPPQIGIDNTADLMMDSASAMTSLQVRCGSLEGTLHLATSMVHFFGTSRLEAMTPCEFVREAGGNPQADWRDTVVLAFTLPAITLRDFLQQQGIWSRPSTWPQKNDGPSRSFVPRRSSQRSSNTDWGLERSTKDMVIAAEDSMAAEVLMSLCRHT